MKIKIKKLNSNVILPTYAHEGDAGMDLYSLEDYTLKPGERKIFYLGFALEFPKDYVALVKDKSSLSLHGVHTMGGVFDASYRGEYNVLLINYDQMPYEIKKGHKIAQLVILPIGIAELEEVDTLTSTPRGDGNFGSTGK